MKLGTKVVITTNKDRRGVFFGTLKKSDAGCVTLSDARNAVYWSRETKGFLGLSAHGPQKGSRISPAVPEVELDGVTSITKCTEQAIQAWEAEPWD